MATKNQTSTSLDDADDTVIAALAGEQAGAVEVLGKNNDPALSGRKAVIKVHPVAGNNGGDEGDNDAVPVGLNGYLYQIPRGIACRVPVEVVAILETALMKIYPTKGGIVIGEREVPRHAYSVISMDPELKKAA